MILHIIQKPTSFYLFLFLSLFFINKLFAQDMIVLKSGEEVPVKIYSTKGKMITYNKWDEQANAPSKLNKKHLKRYVLEYMKNERMSFSFSLGGLPYGTSTNLKKYMRDHGYEGTASGWLGTIKYPVSNVKSSMLLELEYLFNPPHGLSIEYAYANTGNVKGLETPRIYYTNDQLAFCYKYYLKNFRTNLQTGLILNFGSVKEERYPPYNDTDIEEKNLSYGLLIGLATPIVEKRNFFVRLQTQFRYILPVNIKNSEMFLNDENVSLSHLFIGLQTGIKIYTNNGL